MELVPGVVVPNDVIEVVKELADSVVVQWAVIEGVEMLVYFVVVPGCVVKGVGNGRDREDVVSGSHDGTVTHLLINQLPTEAAVQLLTKRLPTEATAAQCVPADPEITGTDWDQVLKEQYSFPMVCGWIVT